MITAIAIDDEPLALAVISAFCAQVDFVDLERTFTKTTEALAYLESNPVDLLFLDINMPAMSGLDLYQKVSDNTMVIFTTAHSQYAVTGFDLSAVDCLLKPIEFGRFQKAVEKAKQQQGLRKTAEAEMQYLKVKADYSTVRIATDEILYLEGKDNYIKIYFDSGKTMLVRMSMKAMSEKLPPGKFVRVHRSFLVAARRITAVRNKSIYLGDIDLPIGVNYQDEVMQLFK